MEHPRSFRLASSEFPSGLAWVMNFLVELDVLIYNTRTIEETWTKRTDGSYTLNESERILKQWLPALNDSTVRSFRDDIVVRWSHEFPTEPRKEDKIILVVRDGRDAVHSSFKRYGWNTPLPDWLHAPYGPMRVTPPEKWALFNYLWITHTVPRDLLLVRFDDLKTAPETTTANLLAFMGLAPDPRAVTRAIASSGFERVKQGEARYKQKHSDYPNTINRRGALKEWKEVYGDAELHAFAGFPAAVLAWFGYEVPTRVYVHTSTTNLEPLEKWDQASTLARLPELVALYTKTPHLEKYWRRFKRREHYIALRGTVISLLRHAYLPGLYTIAKWVFRLYRAVKKRLSSLTRRFLIS